MRNPFISLAGQSKSVLSTFNKAINDLQEIAAKAEVSSDKKAKYLAKKEADLAIKAAKINKKRSEYQTLAMENRIVAGNIRNMLRGGVPGEVPVEVKDMPNIKS